jgi:hypothetical protein
MTPAADMELTTEGPGARSRRRRARQAAWRLLAELVRAVSSADPDAIDAAAAQLGRSRRYLAPLGWAAGTIGLMLGGVKLLIVNWRLSLLELVPALCIWLTTWDLKQHFLYGTPFQQLNGLVLALLWVAVVLLTILSLACNTVFAFAIDEPPPRIIPAARQARAVSGGILGWGVALGGALAFAVVIVPRVAGLWLYGMILSAVLAVMMTAFVAVPARLIGLRRTHPRTLRQRIGGYAVGGVLSAVAVAPGYIVSRLGLIFLGFSGWRLVGFVLLTSGTALFAGGLSAARAVKLGSKLVESPTGTLSDDP